MRMISLCLPQYCNILGCLGRYGTILDLAVLLSLPSFSKQRSVYIYDADITFTPCHRNINLLNGPVLKDTLFLFFQLAHCWHYGPYRYIKIRGHKHHTEHLAQEAWFANIYSCWKPRKSAALCHCISLSTQRYVSGGWCCYLGNSFSDRGGLITLWQYLLPFVYKASFWDTYAWNGLMTFGGITHHVNKNNENMRIVAT